MNFYGYFSIYLWNIWFAIGHSYSNLVSLETIQTKSLQKSKENLITYNQEYIYIYIKGMLKLVEIIKYFSNKFIFLIY